MTAIVVASTHDAQPGCHSAGGSVGTVIEGMDVGDVPPQPRGRVRGAAATAAKAAGCAWRNA